MQYLGPLFHIIIAALLALVCSPALLHAQDAPTFSREGSPYGVDLHFASPADNCSEGRKLAEKDINEKKPCLLLAGGIAPVAYTTDKDFEREFRISYLYGGCTGSPEPICATAYDTRMFQYLTENFGKAWRKKIRKDVLGFREWKRKN